MLMDCNMPGGSPEQSNAATTDALPAELGTACTTAATHAAAPVTPSSRINLDDLFMMTEPSPARCVP